jgi:hypothetical protein
MTDLKIDNHIKASKSLYLLFVIFAIISFLYAIITNTYNGDFLGVEVKLPIYILLFNLLMNIIPFVFIYKVYSYFKKKQQTRNISIPINFLTVFLFILLIWNASVTILYGVGVMGAPPYEAPSAIKIVIQIMNRFNYSYGIFIYILASDKKNKIQFLLVLGLLILAYLRSGLGVFMYLGMIFYIKYNDEFIVFMRKRKLIIVFLLFLFPIFVNAMYSLRDALRNQSQEDIVIEHPMTGKFIGRLSSFSDSAIILQEIPYFFLSAVSLDDYYFQKQALGGVLSKEFMPQHRPELIMIKFIYESAGDDISYMAGTNGNLYFSILHSPFTFIINIATIIFFIFLTFHFFRMLKFNYSNELAFILLLYVLMSGVSHEFSFLLFSIFVYVVLFLIINLIKK